MPERTPLGVLFVSGVRHAASYLPVFAGRPDVQVRALCEEAGAPDWARADSQAVAAACGVPYEEGLEALHRPDVDVAVVCSEPVRHARLAVEALAAGRHVLVDKPMASGLDEASIVVGAAAAATGCLTVVNRLASAPVWRARAWVDTGLVGFPRHVDVEHLASGSHFSTSVERPELVADPNLAGGGELRNFMGYAVDLVRHLTGCEPVSAFAETATLFFAEHRRHGVEDVGVVSLLLEHDVTATLTVGRVPQAPTTGAGTATLRLIGSHGYFTMDEDAPALQLWDGAQGPRSRALAGLTAAHALENLVDRFLGAVREGRAPDYGARDGWAAVAAVDAAYRSAAEGQPVPVARLAP